MKRILLAKSILIFLSTITVSFAQSNEIGLVAEQQAYINLKALPFNDTKLSGHISLYDKEKGFVHQPLFAKQISEGGEIKLTLRNNATPFASLDARYKISKKDKNTVWKRVDECDGRCVNILNGTTLKTSPDALEFLRFYEKNIDKNAQSVDKFLKSEDAFEVFCDAGFENYCYENTRVGLVMNQSQVGAAEIIASAFNIKNNVATFSTKSFNGAVVETSPQLVQAVYESVGSDLSDGVIDVRNWRVISTPSKTIPIGHEIISFELDHKDNFFYEIIDNYKKIDSINSSMQSFFDRLPVSDLGCSYDVLSNRPILDCYFHSDDLLINIPSVWIRMFSVVILKEINDSIVADLFFVFERKFDKKHRVPPLNAFSAMDFSDINEVYLIDSAVSQIANALRKHFQPDIVVMR